MEQHIAFPNGSPGIGENMVSKTYKNDGLEGRPTTIATLISWQIDPSNELNGSIPKDYMKKYVPFNSLFVRNNDSNTIQVYPNGSYHRMKELPQGATMTSLNEPFKYLIIKNVGSGTVASGNIVVNIERLEKK